MSAFQALKQTLNYSSFFLQFDETGEDEDRVHRQCIVAAYILARLFS